MDFIEYILLGISIGVCRKCSVSIGVCTKCSLGNIIIDNLYLFTAKQFFTLNEASHFLRGTRQSDTSTNSNNYQTMINLGEYSYTRNSINNDVMLISYMLLVAIFASC